MVTTPTQTQKGSGRGPLVIVSGPSGVGKTTVARELLRSTTLCLRRAITATSRMPRPGEANGVDYHFWSAAEFERAIEASQLLEYAVVHGRDYYGTPVAEVEPWRQQGYGVLLVIDIQGAAQIRAKYPNDHLSVFITSPSWEILEQRLRNRGTEDEAKVLRRLATAREELAHAHEFTQTLVNDDLQTTTFELEQLIHNYSTARS